MLIELSINSFALVDDLTIPLHSGLSVLTGETGAGKSILIDALSAALGERISTEVIRSGTATATIDAVFDASNCPRALEAVASAGLVLAGDNLIVLSRQISSGRSQSRINGRPVTLAILQDISRHLVDVHGQHEHQALIHEENHLEFLDNYGPPEHLNLRREYETAYVALEEARRRLTELRSHARDREQRLDMLRFQVKEIGEAELRAEEEEELQAERKRLNSVEKLRELADEALRLLSGGDEAGGAGAALAQAAGHLQRLAEIDPALRPNAEEMRGAATVAAEAEHALQDYCDGLDADPRRLEQIEQRLDLIARLKRKYGDTLPDVLSYQQQAEQELAAIEHFDEQEAALTKTVRRAAEQAAQLGLRLSEARRELGQTLSEAVARSLQTLGMPAAQFEVEFQTHDDPEGLPTPDGPVAATARGLDEVRFLFCANEGEELRPLARVASGGELSRIMLAFKSLCSRGAEIPTIIFDEVDAGIGGQVAHHVGERLADLSRHAQVLCVTHLPQIAGLADHHLHVEKAVSGGRTIVAVRELPQEERVAELARMFGAAEDDPTAQKHARKLLQAAAARRAG